jgi:hypothetical protein
VDFDITGIITQLGISVLFVYLYMKERARSAACRDEHVRDLRFIASIKHDRLGDEWNGRDQGEKERPLQAD